MAVLQQVGGALQTAREHIAMGRQADAELEHARKVIGRQRHPLRQRVDAQWLVEVLLDVIQQVFALVRGQPALDLQILTAAAVAEQAVIEDGAGQAGTQQAFRRLVPVELAESAKARGLQRLVDKGAFMQPGFARLTVEQAHSAEGKLLNIKVQVDKAQLAVHHPGRLMLGRQDAQLIWGAFVARLITAESAQATVQITADGVMARRAVTRGVMSVGPHRQRHALSHLRATLKRGA